MGSSELFSPRLERAMRLAARWHDGQVRRGSATPYAEHAFAVAAILDRAGLGEDAVIAGLLHDAVEDTSATLGEIAEHFGPEVADLVAHCSEVKADAEGRKRPWIDRKRDHLAALTAAPAAARAVVLADKLHNLASIAVDLDEGRPVWELFHADRDRVLWYYREAIAVCGRPAEDARLDRIAEACRDVLGEVERRQGPLSAGSAVDSGPSLG